jgi:UPF0755 protein
VSVARWHPFRPRNLAGLLAAVVVALAVKDLLFPLGFHRDPEPTVVLLPPGGNVDSIARELEARGLIKSPFAFGLLARVTGVDRNLKAGQYRIHRGESVPEILKTLSRGMSGEDLVTIPEGLTLRDVALVYDRDLGVPADSLLAACADTALLRELSIPAPTLEGYLFPSSYAFLPGTPAATIVRRMVAETRRVLAEELAGDSPVAHELSAHQVLTLASIVEAEAARPEERERIAAVYLNRLRKGMRLQADPTVAYALGGYRERLYYSDLRVESPYNTYRNAGLPPGPIGNPGRASIHAVLWPRPGSHDLFFVARGDGGHVFSETGEAHEAARQAIRVQRRAASGGAVSDSTAAVLDLPARRAGLTGSAPPAGGGPSKTPETAPPAAPDTAHRGGKP